MTAHATEGGWAWIPRAVGGATLVSMAVAVGMWIGGRDTGSTSRLDSHDDRFNAQAARLDRHDLEINILERVAQDNAAAIAKLIQRFDAYGETRTLIVQASARDREQLNERVAALENDRIVTAAMQRDFAAMREMDERQNKVLEAIVKQLDDLRERLPTSPQLRGRN